MKWFENQLCRSHYTQLISPTQAQSQGVSSPRLFSGVITQNAAYISFLSQIRMVDRASLV